MTNDNPYHEGELAVQAHVNEADMARMNGRVISDRIPGGALHFIEQQAMVVFGSMDGQGQIWCSAIFGEPGFLRALDACTLALKLGKTGQSKHDPLWSNLTSSEKVGIIIIEVGSRRRLRVNGRMRQTAAEQFIIKVEQAYPNCPKYIQRRHVKKAKRLEDRDDIPAIRGTSLNNEQQALIASADTFFVASAHPEHGIDASHRGGQPGFVKILNNILLRIPDYAGNSMFNTLGNFQSYPHAGLVFVDFRNHRLLQLSGKPEIIWHLDSPDEETGGTQRYWQFSIKAVQETSIPFDIDWEFLDYSPYNPQQSKLRPESEKMLFLKVRNITRESDKITSFILSDSDGKKLPEFQPGAHLKVKVITPDNEESERHYSILSNPDDKTHYEIGVQLESKGRGGSLYLHKKINVGDILQIEGPQNDFPMRDQASHTILIAGGIGITPIISMLHRLASKNRSYEIHYTARKKSDLVFVDRIRNIAGNKLYCYTSKEQFASKLDLHQLLASPSPGTHIYVCGPRRMIRSACEIANDNGWQPNQIHYESFGGEHNNDERALSVYLKRSHKIFIVPANKSILDCLLEAGIDVPHECKRGECSMCTTHVLDGMPEHRDLCLSKEERRSSMCLCVSRAKSETLTLEL